MKSITIDDKLNNIKISNISQNKSEQCLWYDIAKEQKEIELERGLPKKTTKGYQDMGCYNCNGYNIKCSMYKKP